MASSPSATSPIGGVAVANTTTTASSKKHSPTISNLLAPTTSTASSTTVPVSTNSVTAIPSPVSSTSSLSSISIPSRLGSSTPPVTTPTGNTNVTNTPSSSVATPTTNLQSPAISTQPQMHPHPGLEHTMQQLGNSPLLSSHPAALGLPPSLNGPGSMPHHLMGLGSLGPLGHMPYRAIYPYGPLYSPYGMPHHPYGAMPPTPIPPSALSPRSLENRRDSSPLVLSKPIKPITPNSNSQPSNNSQSSSNSTTPAGPNTATTISPRSFSPREKDSFSVNSLSSKSSAATPGSSVIPQSPLTAHPSSSSLLAPYVNVAGQPLTAASSASGIYPSSSLPYPAKIPSLIAPPSSWPHPSAHPSSVSSPVTTIAGQRQTQSIPASNTSSPFTATPSFTAPLPPPPAVPTTVASVNSLPFSAESLLTNKPDQTDLLRRELDSRFLDRSGMGVPTSQSNQSSVASAMPTSSAPSTQTSSPGSANQAASLQQSPSSNLPFLRQELHHHQHQHTHLHQHQHQHQGILPTAPAGSLFPPPLFKDIPKIGAGDSPFYRTAPLMGMPPYSAYPSGMLHPGLSGPTQFVPPSHLQSFVPKKTGRWNAMHVRIAWEIYHHQAKQNPDKASSAGGIKTENMLRPHMYVPPPSPNVRQHELTTPSGFPQTPPSLQGRPFDPLSPNFLGTPSGLGVSPFGRYASPFASPFSGLSPYSRELPMGAGPLDPWRSPLSRTVGGYPPTSLASNWGSMKPDPGLDAARREAEERERQMREREERERERQRREREDRERKEREREEKLRKEQQEREQRERERERKEKERREMERREMERERMLQQQRLNDNAKAVRDRSPLRNGDSDIRIKEEPRKDEQEMMMRADPRYQMAAAWQMGRHPAHMLPPPHLSRQGMLPPGSLVGLPPHYATAPGWPSPLDPYRDYRLMDPMMRSYQIPNPMLDAMRAEEAKAYAQASAMYANRGKVPSPQPGHPPTVPSPHHHRMPPNGPMGKPPSIIPSPLGNDMHKKEDAPR